MDAKEMESLIQAIQADLTQANHRLQALKAASDQLIEENNRLRMTQLNLEAHLKEEKAALLQDIPVALPPTPAAGPAVSRTSQERMQAFYDEGIHICHHWFGSKREVDDECLFCQAVLDSLDSAKS